MKLSSKFLDTVIRFLFNLLIVREIGISCEVVKCLFLPFFIILLCSSNKMHHAPFISINIFQLQIHSPIHFNFDYMVAYRVQLAYKYMLKKFQCNTGNFNHLRLNRLCFTQNLIVFILKENVSYNPVKSILYCTLFM